MNGIAQQIEASYQPAIRVGDTMRVTVPLLEGIYEQPGHSSAVVRVERIVIESDGTKTLWLSNCQPIGDDVEVTR